MRSGRASRPSRPDLPAVLAGSVLIHVLLLGLLGELDRPRHHVADTSSPRLAGPDLELIDVVAPLAGAATATGVELVVIAPAPPGDVAPAPAPAPTALAPATTRPTAAPPAPGAGALTTSTGAGSSVTASEGGAGTTPPGGPDGGGGQPGPGALRMRRPDLTSLPDSVVAAEAARAVPGPTADVRTGLIQPAGGGTARADEGVFTMQVGRDGQATIKDARNLRVKLALPSPRDLGRALAAWAEDPIGQSEAGPIKPQPVAIGAPRDPEQRKQHAPAIMPILSGGFDLTDWAMRSSGADPYAARKLALLDATRDERVGMARAEKARTLAGAEASVRTELARLWARTDVDAPTRRRLLFELWDACVEDGPAAEVEAGARVRRQVVAWVRSHLPAGGADGYTAAELTRLNQQRQSRQRFAPYPPAP